MKGNAPLILFFLMLGTYPMSAQNLDSLKLHARFENFEFSNISAVQEFLDLLSKHENDVSTQDRITFATKGAEAAATFKNDSLYVDFYFEVLYVYAVRLNDIEKTRELLKVIENKVIALGSDIRYGRYYNFMGISYYLEKDLVKALENYRKAFQYLKEIAPQKAKSCLYNIKNIYSVSGLYEDAVRVCKEALLLNSYLPQREVYLNTAMANYLIGETFIDEDKLDSTFYYTKKAFEAISKLDTIRSFRELQISCQINLEALIIFSKEGNKSKVDSLLQEVAKCKGKMELFYSLCMAGYYIENEEFDKAVPLLSDTSIISRNKFTRNKLLRLQSLYEKGVGNYEKALELQEESMKLKLKELDEKQSRYIAFANAQFNAKKREADISALKKVAESENRKTQLLILAIVLLLLSLISTLSFYKKTKQNNSLLKNDLENKKTIEKQAEELKKVDKLKSKLFTNISHELRTPLTLISGTVEKLLKKTYIDDTDKKHLLLTKNSSQKLLSLSNQIMDLTKSETDKVKLNLNQFHWSDFIDSVVPIFLADAENRNLTFIETKHFSDNILIQSDLEKLKTVLNNLVQNALKFSETDGTIHLDSIDKGDQLVFSLKDNGRGIHEDDLPHVFKRYFQSKNNVSPEGGFGVGLAVCREYLRLLKGEINIKSKVGEGTVVTVSIPKTTPTTAPVALYTFDKEVFLPIVSTNNSPDKDLTNPALEQLLIVEDNADLRDFLAEILRDDYQLAFAQNGAEALKLLEKINPSIVITDWMMPIMNGITLVKKLRDDQRWQKLPVLMLTARSLPTDQLKAFQKGIDDYLLKPFEVDVLKLRIENLIDNAVSRDDELHFKLQNSEKSEFQDIDNLDSKDMVWINNLEEIIHEKIGTFDLTIDNISQTVGISNAHLHRKVKTIIGLTPMQFINEIRFWEARRMLEEKEQYSVKALAYTVGFKSVKNFSRNFKKRFGKYPSEYLQ